MIKSLILLFSALLTTWSIPCAYADALSINKFINQPVKNSHYVNHVNLSYSVDESNLGISFLNKLQNSHLFSRILRDNNTNTSAVSGISVFATKSIEKSLIYLEIISELKAYSATDFNNRATDSNTFNLETGIETPDLLFAVGYQTAKESRNTELPKKRYIAAYSMDLKKDTALAFEITLDKDYPVIYGGTGNRYVNLTAQLAIAF